MSESIEVRVRQVAADVFDMPLEQVTARSSPQTIETWESVQHLNLILALEQELQVRIDPEEIAQIETIGDAIRLVKDKAGAI
ncbi:MAG: acyl carrier protein [Gammaproteobacteria bacterium]